MAAREPETNGLAPVDGRNDDVEAGEDAPLLSNGADGERAAGWSHYPRQLLSRTSQYVHGIASSAYSATTNKGKQRSTDERTVEAGPAAGPSPRPSMKERVRKFKAGHPGIFWTIVGLLIAIGVVLLLLLIAVAHLFLITLRSPNEAVQQRIIARSLNVDGPDKVELLNLTSEGVYVRIDGRIGLDGDAALNEWLGPRKEKGLWKRKERDLIEWVFTKVKGAEVDVGQVALRSPDWSVKRKVDEIHLLPEGDDGDEGKKIQSLARQEPIDLITFDIEPLLVPLPPLKGHGVTSLGNKDEAPEAKTPLSLTVLLKPSAPDLLVFAQNAIKNKRAVLDFNVHSVRVRGLSQKEWTAGEAGKKRWNVPGWVDLAMGDIWKRLGQDIPKLDNNGTGTDDFLNLTRYDFFEIGKPKDKLELRDDGDLIATASRALGIKAYAEAKNPLGKLLKGYVGYSLPFGVFLPIEDNKDKNNTGSSLFSKPPSTQPKDTVLLAAVATEPIEINGQDKIPLKLTGRVVPPPQSVLSSEGAEPVYASSRNGQKVLDAGNAHVEDDSPGQAALSGFLSRFLRGEPNTVYVHGGSPFTTPQAKKTLGNADDEEPLPGGGSVLPAWLDRALRTLSLPISFPGSKVTDLIQNVTINDLKITPHPFEREKLLCSGTVMGVMNMPGQLATVDVDITDLWPDILVYNGKPPSMRHGGGGGDDDGDKDEAGAQDEDGDEPGKDPDVPEPEPLPDPLPKGAFGRVVPHVWAPATTYLDPTDPKKQRKLLRSELKNVPFTVLPGRGAEFRSFSWKIVTGEGARAGIEGKAKAKIWNSGLGKLLLSNLPVKGVFTVGKRGGDDGDGDGDDGLLL